jgi:hypothetical protein
LAFKEKKPVLWHSAREVMTKYERAMVPSSLKSAVCLPVFPGGAGAWARDEGERLKLDPVGVFCVDSDLDLGLYFESIQETLIHASQLVWEVFRLRKLHGGPLLDP